MMDEEKWKEVQKKARRSTMFYKGSLIPPKSKIKRSVCNVHLILAQEIERISIPDCDKLKLLVLVDEAYNLGKRMAAKLDYYGAEKLKT